MNKDLSIFAMTCEWMENGNINEFIKGHQDANRFELVGFISNVDGTIPHGHLLVAQRRR